MDNNENVIEVKTEGKFKTFVKKHKKALIAGTLGLTGVILLTLGKVKKSNQSATDEELSITDGDDNSKTIDMQFVDPDNGNVLGKIPCTESYAKEMLEAE